MGKDFSVQKALDVARKEEHADRALLLFSGPKVDAVSSRSMQDGGSAHRANQDGRPKVSRPPQASLQDGGGRTSPSCTSSPSAAADTSSPASTPAVIAAARHGIGPTPPLALPGAGRVRGEDIADTSRGSAVLLWSRPVINAHRW
ncbi:hypothetical protein HPB51_008979 [Rhipicephalus microplus]|uniref:Uncharacterized protein n=1 Tax=Rhipicephalus microplus TaxID=6941 RepID=A0A9J6DTF9_RHIMP|nr:hypothetical protein HPB51_008979 [Rhipicephalus microplus]